jgi:hypothetical protein
MQIKDLYEFGPYRLNASALVLLRAGEVVPLTPKALEILGVDIGDQHEFSVEERAGHGADPCSYLQDALARMRGNLLPQPGVVAGHAGNPLQGLFTGITRIVEEVIPENGPEGA